jgi:hypothetical protein
MKRIVLDLETNGFLEQATCVHSMVLRTLIRMRLCRALTVTTTQSTSASLRA